MSDLMRMYKEKLRTADEAVKVVKSGDWIGYSHVTMFPVALDEALAKRVGEVNDVKIRLTVGMHPCQAALADPEHQSFTYHASFFSHPDRHLGDDGLAYLMPSNYSQEGPNITEGFAEPVNVAMIKTTTMDDKGYFNFGTANSYVYAQIQTADLVIVEANPHVPRIPGGNNEHIHISEVDYIVESDHPMITLASIEPTEADKKIAAYLMGELEDGSCIQLGIGGIPNTLGKLLIESDVKDLGCHSEMCNDAYMDLYECGKLTGARKNIDKYKMAFTFCMGTQKLYGFVNNNPACASYDSTYTNSIPVIASNDKMFSINAALQVDLYGQVCSESQGYRQISGTGGQLDFTIGAALSKGGKAFLCLNSTKEMNGKMISRIAPTLTGIGTVPRTYTMNVVTEYGIARIKGQPTYKIAENLVNIAHPDFRDDLIKEAHKMGLWKRSKKIS